MDGSATTAVAPTLSEDEILAVVERCIARGNAVVIETRGVGAAGWEAWAPATVDLGSTPRFMVQLAVCRRALGRHTDGPSVRVAAYDPSNGWATPRTSFLVGGLGAAAERSDRSATCGTTG